VTEKHIAVVFCKDRDDFIKFMDGIVFLAEWESKGLIKVFDADDDNNPIINGTKYIHGESKADFINLTVKLFILVDGWEENHRAANLLQYAKYKTRIYGEIVKMPLVLPDPRKVI
tara:strand:- start:8203 stop:8547 length:345 start_codon:yes stop_codon:yes gene_type:complete